MFFKLTLFKLGCLCRSVWDVAFNDETFFLIRLSSKYKFGYRFIGYRLSNIKNYRLSVSANIFISVYP